MKAKNKRVFPIVVTALVLAGNLIATTTSRADVFTSVGSMSVPRFNHTATLMQNGKVLVAGGNDGTNTFLTAEIYDPAAGSWSSTGAMSSPREQHVAVLLPNGKVLVAGGTDGTNTSSSAELYDPVSGQWSSTGNMNSARDSMAAVRLQNGLVLVAGGHGGGTNYLGTAELYDPASGTWTNTGSFSSGRENLVMALLQNGLVLVAGGDTGDYNSVASGSYLYDPSAGTWTAVSGLSPLQTYTTMTVLPDGRALVAGGRNSSQVINFGMIFDPSTNGWSNGQSMGDAVFNHASTLLPNGQVLCTGADQAATNSSQLFNPTTGLWSIGPAMSHLRSRHTSTLLPDGRVLLAGGQGAGVLASAELYDPTINPTTGVWTNTGTITISSTYDYRATIAPNGDVLIAGTSSYGSGPPSTAAFHPTSGLWNTNTGVLIYPRQSHTMTLLSGGKALIAGGLCFLPVPYLEQAPISEIYDAASDVTSPAGDLNTRRSSHTATLLANGRVLVIGGSSSAKEYQADEVYDPVSGVWAITGNYAVSYHDRRATLLTNGQVLVTGGHLNYTPPLGTAADAWLYDRYSGTWAQTASMNTPRCGHTATLLPNGKVLVVGGLDSGTYQPLTSAEIYDPIAGTWTTIASPIMPRGYHMATLLPNGKVLVAGGIDIHGYGIGAAEVYDPATGSWTLTGSMNEARSAGSGIPEVNAAQLPTGQILIAGGNSSNYAEIYDSGLGYSDAWRPQIISKTDRLNIGSCLTISGTGFGGISGASGGTSQDSSSGYPLVQLRSIENGITTFLNCSNWSSTNFVSVPVTNFPTGMAILTVYANGIPSTSCVIDVVVPVTPPRVTTTPVAGGIQLSFTNTPGGLFGVWTTTNSCQSSTNWTPLGGVAEVAPGAYQFTVTNASSSRQRFYSVRAH